MVLPAEYHDAIPLSSFMSMVVINHMQDPFRFIFFHIMKIVLQPKEETHPGHDVGRIDQQSCVYIATPVGRMEKIETGSWKDGESYDK